MLCLFFRAIVSIFDIFQQLMTKYLEIIEILGQMRNCVAVTAEPSQPTSR